jgi:hypothetical protein
MRRNAVGGGSVSRFGRKHGGSEKKLNPKSPVKFPME